jgi:hypothetical protein
MHRVDLAEPCAYPVLPDAALVRSLALGYDVASTAGHLPGRPWTSPRRAQFLCAQFDWDLGRNGPLLLELFKGGDGVGGVH